MFVYFVSRLSVVQQPRERHHRSQVRLLGRGGDGLLHQLPQDAQLQAKQAHHSLLLQRGIYFNNATTPAGFIIGLSGMRQS